jgi:hypothetical protein
MPMPNDSVNHMDLQRALRMVSSGCATPQEAARICDVPLAAVQGRNLTNKFGTEQGPRSKEIVSPTAVYKRTAKGVLTITRETRNVTPVAKEIFVSIDGQANVADLIARSKTTPAYVLATLKTWENAGLIEIARHATTHPASQNGSDADEDDLDFTHGQAAVQTAMRPVATRRESVATDAATRARAALQVRKDDLEAQFEAIELSLKRARELASRIRAQLASES